MKSVVCVGLILAFIFASCRASFSNDYVVQLFERADTDSNLVLSESELLEEYNRNELPLTPGYEYLISLNSHLHLKPLVFMEWSKT
jgi:hypothetical protein